MDNHFECKNGCHKYSKTMDDVVQAMSKHRDAALAMKEINDKQKKKLCEYREVRMSMQNQIDELEHNLDLEREFTLKVCEEKKELENRLNILTEDVKKETTEYQILQSMKDKEETKDKGKNKLDDERLHRKLKVADDVTKNLKKTIEAFENNKEEQNIQLKELNIKFLETEKNLGDELLIKSDRVSKIECDLSALKIMCKDQKDENLTKDAIIADMKRNLEIKHETMNSSSCSSLADEIEIAADKLEKEKLVMEVGTLKAKILKCENNKKEKKVELDKLENLSINRELELSHLKCSIEKFISNSKTRCRFGWKCRRAQFCKFDHDFLFSKVNKPYRRITEPTKNEENCTCLCDYCGKVFSSLAEYEEHKVEVQVESATLFYCIYCKNEFTSETEFIKHEQYCQEISRNMKDVKKKSYKCDHCEKSFVRIIDLGNHKKSKHNYDVSEDKVISSNQQIELQCDLCDKKFGKKKTLLKHKRSSHEAVQTSLNTDFSPVIYSCSECDAIFPTKSKFDNHAKSTHDKTIIEEEPNKLETSEASNEQKRNENNLIDKHFPDFKCEMCKVNFNNSGQLEAHINKSHAESLRCDLCRMDFENISDMDDHMDKKHEGRWKLNDPDILREGDVLSSSDSSFDSSFESD